MAQRIPPEEMVLWDPTKIASIDVHPFTDESGWWNCVDIALIKPNCDLIVIEPTENSMPPMIRVSKDGETLFRVAVAYCAITYQEKKEEST